MSSNLAYARPVRPQVRPAPAERPHIEIVTTRAQRRARPRAAYAVVTVASLFVIFAAQLLLSIVVSDGAYQIDSLQSRQKDLLRTEQALSETHDLLNSTQHLAENAAKLGMVPNPSPLFLDLATGAVAGAPGTVDPTGCGGTCNLVANSLLTGVPLTGPTTAQPQTSTTDKTTDKSATGTTQSTPEGTVTALPAPVTH
ncbi:hypothetical protein BH11ACT4_BH11ACT4_17030 [soil metagenome]